jgi:hypothetical protein
VNRDVEDNVAVDTGVDKHAVCGKKKWGLMNYKLGSGKVYLG